MSTNLVVVGLAGFAASMVDGALGMGFGPTSMSILTTGGLDRKLASATVNLAKVAVGAAAGVSHWRFGNIDRRLVIRLALPGCAGAVIGATLLAKVDSDQLRPWIAAMLILVGLRILHRFWKFRPRPAGTELVEAPPPYEAKGAEIAGGIGGLSNALTGAWGPIVTPFLLHRRVPPRMTIGSVNTAEIVVATVSAGSLIAALGNGGLDWAVVAAMLIGGVLAAPLAAWVIRFLPARGMGLAVAGLLLITNIREFSGAVGLGAGRWIPYGVVVGLVIAAGISPRFSSEAVTTPGAVEDPAPAVAG